MDNGEELECLGVFFQPKRTATLSPITLARIGDKTELNKSIGTLPRKADFCVHQVRMGQLRFLDEGVEEKI